MVSVLAFYSNDPSLNHTVSSEICVFKRTKISKKEAGIGSGFENVTNVLFHFVPKTLQCKELQKHFFAETRERERERLKSRLWHEHKFEAKETNCEFARKNLRDGDDGDQ